MTGKSGSTSRDGRTRAISNLLIYASVVLGVALLVQLYPIVPSWLFFSVTVGWAAYLGVAIAIWRGIILAYPISLILAFLTLGVSLPQPEHAGLVKAGLGLASLTFIAGSALQVGVILSTAAHLFLMRQERRESNRRL